MPARRREQTKSMQKSKAQSERVLANLGAVTYGGIPGKMFELTSPKKYFNESVVGARIALSAMLQKIIVVAASKIREATYSARTKR
jgi:hypothetical protein